MFTVRRAAARAARRAGRRQYSSDHGAGAHGAEHGHHGADAGPGTESFSTGFYVSLAAIPASIAVYTFSRPGKDGQPAGITKLIDHYSSYKEHWIARNNLHTAMIEQAAFDRNLFQSDKGSAHIELRSPELFNTGSPYNVVAGAGPRGIDQVVARYQVEYAKEEERRIETAKREALAQSKK